MQFSGARGKRRGPWAAALHSQSARVYTDWPGNSFFSIFVEFIQGSFGRAASGGALAPEPPRHSQASMISAKKLSSAGWTWNKKCNKNVQNSAGEKIWVQLNTIFFKKNLCALKSGKMTIKSSWDNFPYGLWHAASGARQLQAPPLAARP